MENIMLMDEKKELVKIVDFGLSNQFDDDNPLRTQCGSPEYAAPELFVKGKKYGPEVDLWSLGVILFVMGTGQLPFTSPRDGQTSSEERRRRLMAQINRGLAAAQERTIAPLSAEYRNLLARLLTPVAHKRILVKELCRHPWIVGRQKLTWSLQMNEDRDLNVTEQNAVLDVIANITNLQRSVVETSIRNKKYGKIGGLFNIMMHEVQRNTLASLFKMQRNITLRMLEKTNSLASSNGSRIKSIQTPPRKKAHIENQESNKEAANSFSIAEYDRNSKKNVSFSVQHKIPIKRSSNIAERLELFNRKAATPNLKKADDRPKTQPCSKKASTPNSSMRPHSYLAEVRNRTLKSDPPSLFQRIAQGTRTQRNVSGASRQSRIIGKVQQSAVGMGQGDERRIGLLRQAKIKQDALIKARATLEATKARERLRGELTGNTKFSRNNDTDNSRYYLKKPQNLIKNLDKLKWKNYTFTQPRLDSNEKKKNFKAKVENSSKRNVLPRIAKDVSKKVIQLH